MQQEDEIHGILPNLDQAKFIELANRAKDKLCRRSPDPVSLIGYNGQGRVYQDYVVSIRASKDGKKFEASNRKHVALRRKLTGSAVPVEIDSAGRIALGKVDASDATARTRLGLERDVTVVGVEDHFEVWNTQRWEAEQANLADDLDALMFGGEI
jgi:hypothetical protein